MKNKSGVDLFSKEDKEKWRIAAEYADEDHYDSYQNYIDEVLQMNGLSSESITVGQHLVVPYYSAEFVG